MYPIYLNPKRFATNIQTDISGVNTYTACIYLQQKLTQIASGKVQAAFN